MKRLFYIGIPILAGLLVFAFAQSARANIFETFFGGSGTINQLDQFKSTSSPYSAITTNQHARNLYAPFSWATTSGITATTFCLTGDSCRTTWPAGGSGGTGNVATSTGETAGQLAVYTSTNGTPALIGKVATSSLTIGAPLTTSGTPGALVGGTNLTIDIDDIKATDLDLTDITLADFTNDPGYFDALADFTGTLTDTRYCTYDLAGGEIDCDSTGGSGITTLGPTGQGQTGTTQTFATSSDTNIGLTITSTGDTHTFTSNWIGTLANSRLTNSSVSYGGVSLSLGDSDATPAFNLADATGLPLTTGITGTLAVGNGGTGATTFTNNRVLTGNGTSAIVDEANLTFDGSTLTLAGNLLSTSASNSYFTGGGNLGVGSTTPYAKLSVKGAGTGTGVNFQTTNSSDGPLITALDNGRVGIGTTTPNSGLSIRTSGGVSTAPNQNASLIVGLNSVSNSMFEMGVANVQGYGNRGYLQSGNFTNTSGLDFYVQPFGGNVLLLPDSDDSGSFGVAIGTTTPSANLHVEGSGSPTIFVRGATDQTVQLGDYATPSQWVFGRDDTDSAFRLQYFSDTVAKKTLTTSAALTVSTAGNFGLSSSTPGSLLSLGTTNGINFFSGASTTATSTIPGNIDTGGQLTFNAFGQTNIFKNHRLGFFDIQRTGSDFTLARIRAPKGDSNEATLSLVVDLSATDAGVDEEFVDFYNERYEDAKQWGLRQAYSGTGIAKPFVIGHWDTAGGKDAGNKLIILPNGTVGITQATSTIDTNAPLYVASSTAPYLFIVDEAPGSERFHISETGTTTITGANTATSSIYTQSTASGKGGVLILEDVDGAGCTEVSALNGVLSAKTVTCP